MKVEIKSYEVENFENKYKKITRIATDIAMNKKIIDKNEFIDSISKSDYAPIFIYNISSSEQFENNCDLINDAFEKRDNLRLINRIKGKRRKKRVAVLSVIATSIAACFVAASFYLVGDVSNNIQVKELEQSITVPTLIIDNEKIIKLGSLQNKINATEYKIKKGQVIHGNHQQRLIIPKGHTYTVVLEDSTEVTLNAGSELTYATKFDTEVREVFLKGEGYFKVKKNAKPFIVNSFDVNIQVYGTEFNIKANDGEKLETVLISGSVGVTIDGEKEIRMEPNQLFCYNKKSAEISLVDIDVTHYIQWMDGNFNYNDYPLSDVLKDLEKWYSVKFEIMDDMKDEKITFFSSKDEDISKVLRVIEITKNIKFVKKGGSAYKLYR